MTHQPKVAPFDYLLIPCNDADAVKQLRFTGKDDDELRQTIKRHFCRISLSSGQRSEMQESIVKRASEKSPNDTIDPQVYEQALSDTTFEIVPITLPSRHNKFIATSLYIDDAGRFKDLPLNNRASKVAQKDIRGDAFMLSNHDDPALDEWERVDCSATTFNQLHTNPPQMSLDTSNQQQMLAAGALRESDSKVISSEDAQNAARIRLEGNGMFGKGDWVAAAERYTEAICLTEGRRDLLPNEREVTEVRLLAFLNRALCNLKQAKWSDASNDAKCALNLDRCNVKGLFRLAMAELKSRDFDSAECALNECEASGGVNEETKQVRNEIAAGRRQLQKEEKQKFSKLFQ